MKTSYGTILVLAMVVAALFAGPLPCWAAEKEKENIWSEDEPRGKHKRLELTEEKIERIMNRLKETDPEKAEELAQLREKDPEKFKAKLRKIARVHFHKKRTEYRQGAAPRKAGRRGAKPCEAGKVARKAPAHPHGRGGFGGGRGGPMATPERRAEYVEWLGKNYPEEAKKLADLKKKDRGLYARQMGLSFKKYKRIFEAAKTNPELAEVLKENLKLTEKQRKLVKKIKATGDDKEKKQLTEELREVISKKFDSIVKRKQIAYERMLKQLERLKEEIKKSEAQVEKWKDAKFKNESVNARLEELTSGTKKFRWD